MASKSSLLFIALTMNACAMNSQFSPDASLTFDYMQTADAISDAHVALSNNNFTLIGFDQRGLTVPGIKRSDVKNINSKCRIKRVIGMGDVVRSKAHLEQMKKVSRYSLNYNQEILKTSSCQQKSTQ